MADQRDETRVRSELPGLLIPGLVPPLLGVLAYAILRESYTWFYGRYGVVPEDVGINQVRMLTGILRIFHLWSLPIPGRPAASFLIVLITIWAYFALGRWLLGRLRARWPRVEESTVLRHPLLFGLTVLMLLVLLASAWVLPKDRDLAGKRLQLRQGVRPSQLSMLAIQADPVQVIWTGSSTAPNGLVNTRLIYLGHADGQMVLYDPPKWGTCEIDSCRGVVWRVNESDAVVRVEVNPPDAHAPRLRDPSRSGGS
jgi:hypothetical protein